MTKALLSVLLFVIPLSVKAQDTEMSCSVTHHNISDDGTITSDYIGSDLPVHDYGDVFSFVIAGQKVESPELKKVTIDGESALAGKRGELMFIKLDNTYVMRSGGEGYVISDCKLRR